MQKLTKKQEENYARVNAKLTLTEEQIAASYQSLQKAQAKKKGGLIFSSDPLASDVEPIYISVGSIQQLKEMVGPDDTGGKDYPYPPPLTEREKEIFKSATSLADLRSKMSDEFFDKVLKAAEAYVMADPKMVEEYTTLINDLRFPGRLAAFAGDVLNIPAGQTYTVTGSDPVVWNYSQIVVGFDAQILVQTQLTSTSQTIVQQSK